MFNNCFIMPRSWMQYNAILIRKLLSVCNNKMFQGTCTCTVVVSLTTWHRMTPSLAKIQDVRTRIRVFCMDGRTTERCAMYIYEHSGGWLENSLSFLGVHKVMVGWPPHKKALQTMNGFTLCNGFGKCFHMGLSTGLSKLLNKMTVKNWDIFSIMLIYNEAPMDKPVLYMNTICCGP